MNSEYGCDRERDEEEDTVHFGSTDSQGMSWKELKKPGECCPCLRFSKPSASHVFIEDKEPRDVIDVQTMWDILIDGSMKCVPDECKIP